MSWKIESVRDAAVAPADIFKLYADPSTWSEVGRVIEMAGRHVAAEGTI